MKRQLLLSFGFLMLFVGWLSTFLYRVLPYAEYLSYLLPTLCFAVGIGLVNKLVGGRLTAVALALTAVVSVLVVNMFYPGFGLSLSAIKNNISIIKNGKSIKLQVKPDDQLGVFAQDRYLNAFTDLEVKLFARVTGTARMLVFDDKGNLFVSIPNRDAIYRLTDTDKDGYADQSQLYYLGSNRPHGLLWHNQRLYVAETSQLLELQDLDQDGKAEQVRVVLNDLPDDGGHWTRSLAMGKAGFLYLSIGSSCNRCPEKDERRASVLKVDPRTGQSVVFARGLRNSVGLAFSADGQTLWASENGRDNLGDDLPPDEINLLVAGGDYGWPHCYGKQIVDSETNELDICKDTIPSAVDIPAHSAPLGITFGDSLAAADTFRKSLFVALHGSWNRGVPTGYKLIRIPFVNGQPQGQGIDVLSGWLENGKAWGRPVAPIVGPDGALYLSDDLANAIYRIQWSNDSK